jgi:DNA-binding transcriptional ArsR family regulator
MMSVYYADRLNNQVAKYSLPMPAPDPLSTTFAALADPTRRALLARLAQGDATVGELAKPFAMSLPGVSKHLKVLQQAGLVVQGRDAQWRPCRLDPTGLEEVSRWVEQYRSLWEGRLDRMEAYLRELERQETAD